MSSFLQAAFVGAIAVGLFACAADATTEAPPVEAEPAASPATEEDESSATSLTVPRSDFEDHGDSPSDPNAPSPIDDPALPAATQDQLIKTFAPHLHLHPEDTYRPANVDWYLARVTMRFSHNNCPDHEIFPVGKVTQALLVSQKHADNKSFCRHDDSKVVTSTASESFFLEVTDHASYTGSPRKEWKTYAVWRPRATGGLVDVEYWFFYPYNDGFSIFNHESDWEHVRVTIDPKGNGGQGTASEVKYSAHHGGTTLPVTDQKVQIEDGTHVVAYVSKGSHANYPQPGVFAIEGTAGVAKDTAVKAPAADVWKTETQVVNIGTRAAPKNGQVFVKYWGHWGEINDIPETNGIRRHFP